MSLSIDLWAGAWWRGLLFGLILAAVTIFAYRPAWNGGFLWDDDVYITNNELLTAPEGLRRIWFSLDSPSQYFPLVYTTFRIEHGLWGLNSTGYHWVNLVLHADFPGNRGELEMAGRVPRMPAALDLTRLTALGDNLVECDF